MSRTVARLVVAGPRDAEQDAEGYPPVTRRDTRKVREYAAAYGPPAWRAEALPAGVDFFLSPEVPFDAFRSQDGDPWFTAAPAALDLFGAVVDAIEGRGVPRGAVRVISGYRSAAHNRGVDGSARSRHRFGDAIDFVVDADGDGRWDDADGDGDVDGDDLWPVAMIVEGLQASVPAWAGGCGLYLSDTTLGSVHVDTRGHRARWGTGALDRRWARGGR